MIYYWWNLFFAESTTEAPTPTPALGLVIAPNVLQQLLEMGFWSQHIMRAVRESGEL